MQTNVFHGKQRLFNYENLEESTIINKEDWKRPFVNCISACGVLFYKVVDNKVKLLLINYHKQKDSCLDDFGGKIKVMDKSLVNAMTREVSEETNYIITPEYLNIVIYRYSTRTFYNRHAKYYMWLVEVDNTFYPDTTIFGDYELLRHTNSRKTRWDIPENYRMIRWYDYECVKDKLAKRLLHNHELIYYLNSIY